MSIFRTGREAEELKDDLVSARATIAALEKRIADKDHYIKSLEAEVTEVRRVSTYYEKRIAELEARRVK